MNDDDEKVCLNQVVPPVDGLVRDEPLSDIEVESKSTPASSWHLTLFVLITAIVLSWVLVSLWTRWIENLAYVTLGLNINSTWHTLIVALTVTVMVVAYIHYLQASDVDVEKTILATYNIAMPSHL